MFDIVGKPLSIGCMVAFCMAGRSSDMRVGEVVRMTKKQVEIEYTSTRFCWEAKGMVEYRTTCMRNAENVVVV